MWLLIAVGIVLRLRQYLFNRSLWIDEAAIASSIVTRSYPDLFKTLDYGLTAPFGFLVASKFVVDIFGNNELALRFIPFISGVFVLIIFYQIGRRYLTPSATTIALGILVFSPPLIYLSSEAKQYSVDLLVATILLWLTLSISRSKIQASMSFPPILSYP